MVRRFFVTVLAPTKHDLVNLTEYSLDLFQPTAKVTEQNEYAIDELLNLEEFGRLAEEGYRVVVKEESSKKAGARTEVAEFQQWIRGMEE
jgi:hypothetical protein